MIKNKKNGFTLTETLITMGLLGVLAAVLLPTLQAIQPNQNKLLLRKGYQVVERTVNTLINDDSLYPNETSFASSTGNVFCKRFQDTLNFTTVGTCPSSGAPKYIGTTPDGIDWYYLANTFTQSATAYNNVVLFDVNGSAKSPNCATSSTSALPTGYSKCGTGKKPDLFKVGIRWDGKLHFGGVNGEADSYATGVLSSVTNNMSDK